MKVISNDIIHKSNIDGVAKNVNSKHETEQVFTAI
ncbi:MAG: hypothetical protein HQ522_23060 [Bacteroidetes bacterium]|nr:hypothetical protein [Bacteroidota bacterium]